MGNKTRKQLVDEISDLCEQHRCNDKIAKVHQSQYADRGWNPHPPQHFVNWWGSTGKETTKKNTDRSWDDIDSVRAFNCEAVREVYQEAKQFGISRVE